MINPDAKHPCIYDDENVTLYLEICPDGLPLLHCEVRKWTHNTFKEFREIWANLTDIFKEKKYIGIYAPEMDNKLYRFAKMFGFEATEKQTLGEDGVIRRLICHKL